MNHIFEGDEWKHAKAAREADSPRAQRQARADADYAMGRIGLNEWRRITDELSEPRIPPLRLA